MMRSRQEARRQDESREAMSRKQAERHARDLDVTVTGSRCVCGNMIYRVRMHEYHAEAQSGKQACTWGMR